MEIWNRGFRHHLCRRRRYGNKFEKKVINLLNTYNRTEIAPISLEEYDVDLLWNSDNV